MVYRDTQSGDSIGIFSVVFRKENRQKSETKLCYNLGMRLNGVNIYTQLSDNSLYSRDTRRSV